MNTPPDEQRNLERRRELLNEEESFRLQREEQRLELARRDTTVYWISNSIYLLVGLLEILLGLRFILRLFGANTGNAFAAFIYTLSQPFIAPFSTLFVSPVTQEGASIFDVNVLVAMIVYALLAWIVVSIVRFIGGR